MTITSEPQTAPGPRPAAAARPRVLFLGGTRYDLPLRPGLARKWAALKEELDLRVVARAGSIDGQDSRFRLIDTARRLRGPAFYLALARVAALETRSFRPAVVVCQSPYEAFAGLAGFRSRQRPKLVVELHADWRTASRLYGSPLRRSYAALADRAALFAIRQADATRALSRFTAELAEEATGEKPLANFTTYFDLESFTNDPPRPLPAQPAVAWIGVLERYKDPGTLAAAWRIVASEIPESRLVVVGGGPLSPVVDELAREFPERVRAVRRLEPPEIAQLLDQSTVLAMSSAAGSEGVPRVIMEAFARGRPVVCTAAGGSADIVAPERSGLVVEPGSPEQLARALVRVLGDRRFAERLAAGAREGTQASRWNPQSYAAAVRELVERAIATD